MSEPDRDGFCCPPLTSSILDEVQAAQLAGRLKALSDPVRIRLVSLLACTPCGELCACDLPELVGRSQPTVSHHLKLLTEAGIIEREQRGKWAWFRLAPGSIDQILVALGGRDSSLDPPQGREQGAVAKRRSGGARVYPAPLIPDLTAGQVIGT